MFPKNFQPIGQHRKCPVRQSCDPQEMTSIQTQMMRIKINQTKNQGSVLLVTLCTAWVIGIALVSYLTLVANQNRTTYHSQSWSGCIPVLEAGIEEALTQLNVNNGEGVANAVSRGRTLVTNG